MRVTKAGTLIVDNFAEGAAEWTTVVPVSEQLDAVHAMAQAAVAIRNWWLAQDLGSVPASS